MFAITCTHPELAKKVTKIFVGTLRERKVAFGEKPVRLQEVPPEILDAAGEPIAVRDGEGAWLGGFVVETVERRALAPAAGEPAGEDAEA